MGWRYWLPRLYWEEISAEEAMEIGLEQAGRWQWAVLQFEWFGFGLTIGAKVVRER